MQAIARPRDSWNPVEPKTDHIRAHWDFTTKIRVHHTVTRQPTGRGRALIEDEKRVCRELQATAFVRGYSDVSYNLAIMPSGRRYWLRGAEILGAHTLHHNTDFGVCFPGNYDTTKPTKRSLISFWAMRRLARRRWGISPKVYPHSDTFPTACPGRYLKAALKLDK